METSMSASVGGIQRATETHYQRAQRVSKAEMAEDITKDMAEMHTDPQRVKMNTAAIRAQDEMLGSLLDMFA
jgi:hypothetical protein